MPRTARTVGVLVPVALLVALRLHDAHAVPVGLELVGNDHRHAGANALPHLGAVADDADDAVLADGDEHERIVDPAMRHAVCAVLRRILGAGHHGREADGEHQSAERGGLLQEATPAHIGNHELAVGHRRTWRRRNHVEGRVHAVAPFAPAACLIAARIRP